MTQQRTWPERDRAWVTRYRTAIAGAPVPVAVVEQREGELLDAVHAAGLPAVEVFGDAADLAAEDAADLATEDEAVRTSEGGGLRTVLREVGGTLTAFDVVSLVVTVVRHGWFVDLEVAAVLVAASVLVVVLGWVLARASFSAGRPAQVAGVLLAVLALGAGGLAAAVAAGPDAVAVRGLPVPLLAVGLLLPGVVVLGLAGRTPEPTLRQQWDDDEWLRRLRGGLLLRLVPGRTRRAHVAEVQQQLLSTGAPAHAEFGHPLTLARELARADRTARARWWWTSTVLGTAVPLLLGSLILLRGSWGVLSTVLGAMMLLAALHRPVAAWSERPWGRRV